MSYILYIRITKLEKCAIHGENSIYNVANKEIGQRWKKKKKKKRRIK